MEQGDRLMATAMGLASSLEALAALAAHVRVEREGLDADPRVRELLRDIAAELLGGSAEVGGPEGAQVVGMTRTLMAQAAGLVAAPDEPPGWGHADPELLQGAGRMSTAIAGVIATAATGLDGLAASLGAPGAAILDVGTGTGWLALALARTFPAARVVGIDLYPAALELARGNVAAAGLGERVELRLEDATRLADDAAYDAVWLPLPFLPREIVPAVVAVGARALRPGGWLLPGAYGGPPDRVSQLVVDLRTVRSGGHPWDGDDLVAVLAAADLDAPHEVRRSWQAPVRLFAARRRA
jgi:SAM-dependent methyltransferase